jgi:hypothetical protein
MNFKITLSFFNSTVDWTQAFNLLCKFSITWASYPTLLYFSYFSDRVLNFFLEPAFGPRSSYLCLLCSWDHWCAPPHQVYWLRCLANIFILHSLALNCDLPDVHLWNRWGYTGIPPCLAPKNGLVISIELGSVLIEIVLVL